jgi:predicted metal-dependent hydrolase
MVELILIGGLAVSLVIDVVLNKREYRRRMELDVKALETQQTTADVITTSNSAQLVKYSEYLEEQRQKSEKLLQETTKKIDDSLLENSAQVENVLSNFVDKLEEKDKKTIQFILDVATFMEEVEDLAETADQIANLQMFTNQPALQELKTQTVYLAKRAKAMRKEIEGTGVADDKE